MKYDLKLSDGSSLTICAVKTLTDQWVYSASRNGSECGVTLIKSGENMLYALGDKLYSMENDRYRNAENLAAANMTARDFFRDSAEAIVSHFRQYGLPTDLPLWG